MESFETRVENERVYTQLYHPQYADERIVLFCHGFPGTNRLPHLAGFLDSTKTSLAEINYRGDAKSTGKFSFLRAIDDIKEVTTSLREKYLGTKVYGLGYSCGGLYVLNIVRDNPHFFDGVYLLNPVLDTYFLSDSPLMAELWDYAKNMLSLEEKNFYQRETATINKNHNPMDFAGDLETSVTLFQSTEDEVLPLADVHQFMAKLKGDKKLILIPQRQHDLEGNEREIKEGL